MDHYTVVIMYVLYKMQLPFNTKVYLWYKYGFISKYIRIYWQTVLCRVFIHGEWCGKFYSATIVYVHIHVYTYVYVFILFLQACDIHLCM